MNYKLYMPHYQHQLTVLKFILDSNVRKYNPNEPIIIDKSIFSYSSSFTIILQFEINTLYYKVNTK